MSENQLDKQPNYQMISKQLARFFAKVQTAENRGDTSYRSMLKNFRLLDVGNRNTDYYFDAMKVLYEGGSGETKYWDSEIKAFLATLKLYSIAYGSKNRKPNSRSDAENGYRYDFPKVCANFAKSTQNQEWCNSRISAFLDSKKLDTNFKCLENLVSRMGNSGYKLDYIRLFRDLNAMFSKPRTYANDVRKRWAEQYVRSLNRINTNDTSNERN